MAKGEKKVGKNKRSRTCDTCKEYFPEIIPSYVTRTPVFYLPKKKIGKEWWPGGMVESEFTVPSQFGRTVLKVDENEYICESCLIHSVIHLEKCETCGVRESTFTKIKKLADGNICEKCLYLEAAKNQDEH